MSEELRGKELAEKHGCKCNVKPTTPPVTADALRTLVEDPKNHRVDCRYRLWAESQKLMWEVGVEGDRFNAHPYGPECDKQHCVPVDLGPLLQESDPKLATTLMIGDFTTFGDEQVKLFQAALQLNGHVLIGVKSAEGLDYEAVKRTIYQKLQGYWADFDVALLPNITNVMYELTATERKALQTLNQYGGAEDCRAGLEEVAAFETLAAKGLVIRKKDETYINEAGKRALAQ